MYEFFFESIIIFLLIKINAANRIKKIKKWWLDASESAMVQFVHLVVGFRQTRRRWWKYIIIYPGGKLTFQLNVRLDHHLIVWRSNS